MIFSKLVNYRFKNIHFFVALFLFSTTLILCLRLNKELIRKNEHNEMLTEGFEVLKIKFLEHYLSEGDYISPETQLMNRSDTIALYCIMGNSPKLVFRFSENSCLKCVDFEVSLIKSMLDEIGRENVLILASFSEMRDALIFQRMNGLRDILFYNIDVNSLRTNSAIVQEPYFFIIDSTYMTRNVFIPDTRLNGLTEEYLETIKSYF